MPLVKLCSAVKWHIMCNILCAEENASPCSVLALGEGYSKGDDDPQSCKAANHTAGHHSPMMIGRSLGSPLLRCSAEQKLDERMSCCPAASEGEPAGAMNGGRCRIANSFPKNNIS